MPKWLCAIVIGMLQLSSAAGASVDSVFSAGNSHYEARHYDSAIAAYELILAIDRESAPLHFNLGNAYFRAGDLGHAILHYAKAERLDPTDADIRANLDFARSRVAVQVDGVQLNPVRAVLGSLVGGFRLDRLGWISSVLFLLLLGGLAYRLGFRGRARWLMPAIYVTVVMFVTAAALTTIKYRLDYLIPRAVIVTNDAPVSTGPSDQAETELLAAAGMMVEIVNDQAGWYEIQLENARRGWIRQDLVAVI